MPLERKMTDEVIEQSAQPEAATEQAASLLNNADTPAIERPEWLLDKYATEDRTQEDAITEQAKAYAEAQKMLGGFTGAPEDYAFTLPEGLEGEVDTELEAYQSFVELAKTRNMSQDTAQELFSIFANYQNSLTQQEQVDINQEMEQLGPNAGQRLQALGGWGNNNLSPEENVTLESMTTNSDQVGVLEKIISMTKDTPIPKVHGDTAIKTGYSMADFQRDVQDERYYSDEHFRKAALKKAAGLF